MSTCQIFCAGPCLPGYYCPSKCDNHLGSGDCNGGFCPSGAYCPEGSDSPLLCPAGTFNNETHSTEFEACLPCPPGNL